MIGKFVNILEVVRRAVALAASNPGTSVPLDLSIERNEATKKFSVCLWDGVGRQKIRCKQQFDSEEEADVCYHWLEDHIKAEIQKANCEDDSRSRPPNSLLNRENSLIPRFNSLLEFKKFLVRFA